MSNPRYQARFPPELAERVDEWSDERGIRDSEALRRLTERGIDSWEDQAPANDADALLERVALALAVAGFVAFMGFFTAWSFFNWALVEPVIVTGVLTVAYLVGAWVVNRWAYRRGSA